MQRTGTEDYYAARAREYDAVYDKPERQGDLQRLRATVVAAAQGRRVLELAAGTGYWTTAMADVATSIVATDINVEVLDVARARRPWPESVRFDIGDAYAIDRIVGDIDMVVAGFLWSHLSVSSVEPFVRGLARRLPDGGRVLLFDNRFVDGSSTPIATTDADGNTYQRRRLEDGSAWTVRKNFPTPCELRAALGAELADVRVSEFDYFWIATATRPLKSPNAG